MRLACSMLAVFVVLSPLFCRETNRAKKHGRVGVSRPTTQRLRSPSASTAPKPVCHPYSQSLAHGARARKSSNASHVLRQQHPAPTIEAPSAYAQRRSAPGLSCGSRAAVRERARHGAGCIRPTFGAGGERAMCALLVAGWRGTTREWYVWRARVRG